VLLLHQFPVFDDCNRLLNLHDLTIVKTIEGESSSPRGFKRGEAIDRLRRMAGGPAAFREANIRLALGIVDEKTFHVVIFGRSGGIRTRNQDVLSVLHLPIVLRSRWLVVGQGVEPCVNAHKTPPQTVEDTDLLYPDILPCQPLCWSPGWDLHPRFSVLQTGTLNYSATWAYDPLRLYLARRHSVE
jgi:hypothetical protein